MKNLTLNINPKQFSTVSQIIKNIRIVSNSYGYTEFYPSSIEYYEERKKVSDKKLNSLVKLIAPTGDVMTLKNDPTLLVTKYACTRELAKVGYSKYFYTTNIFQWKATDTDNSVESIQGGIEYYGNTDIECESEVVTLAEEVLSGLGVTEYKIDIGEVNYLHELLDEIKLSDTVYEEIINLIENKNSFELEKICNDLLVEDKYKEAIINIPKLFGSPEKVIELGYKYAVNDGMVNAVKRIEEFINYMNILDTPGEIEVDLGFTNDQDYYTGIIVKFYSKENGKTILSGGRYDKLANAFEKELPAFGIGFNIKNLMEVLTMKTKTNDNYSDFAVIFDEEKTEEALTLSKLLREKGFSVKTNKRNVTTIEFLSSEYFLNVKKIVQIEGDIYKVIDQIKNETYKVSNDIFYKKINETETFSPIH